MRALLALIAAPGLAGCACLPPPAPETPAFTCPAVRNAEAWVNRMPGPAPQSRNLVVAVNLVTTGKWMLTPAGDAGAPILQLALAPGGEGNPATATWRSSTARPDRIEILCNGAPHHTITSVESVY